jgi:hypothetical protein
VRSLHIFSALGLGLGLGLLSALPLARGDAKASTIAPSEIKEGMKGYGLTVFKGTEPEKFDVEVVGVLHNFRPAQDLILVKTPHPRLNITKNVKGMSGSPIYIEGRLAGAYAYSLSSFQSEPVAGVTPISLMLAELARPTAPGFWPPLDGAPLPANRAAPLPKAEEKRTDMSGTRWDGAPDAWDLGAHAKQIAARLGGGGSSDGRVTVAGTPLLVGGLTKGAMALAEKMFGPMGLEPLAAGGGPSTPVAGAPEHFVDGGSLGVQLARGDVSYMGLGTVTHVEGKRLCGFGHPMMGNGDVALPTAVARVLWIYASEQHSFKVGEAIRPLGALVQDRQSAVVADETKIAPTFPVTVDIKGVPQAPKTHWQMEVAEERFMTPGLVASMLGSAVEATVSESRDATWQLHTKLKVAGYGALELDDFGIAIGGMPEAGDFGASRAVRAIGQLYNNPWSNVRIEGVESTLTVQFTRDLWRLRGVDLLDPVVDAGQKARLVLHMVPFSGPEVSRTVEITVPQDLAGKDVEIEVLPGYEVAIDTAAPENTAQLFTNLAKQSLTPRSVVVQLRAAQLGVAFKGHVAERLPDFALDALRPTTSDVSPEPVASFVRTTVPLEKYLQGRDKVKVKVRSVVR